MRVESSAVDHPTSLEVPVDWLQCDRDSSWTHIPEHGVLQETRVNNRQMDSVEYVRRRLTSRRNDKRSTGDPTCWLQEAG